MLQAIQLPLESVNWSVGDSSLLGIVVDSSGLLASVSAVGPLGTTQVVVKADAQIGEGVVELIGTLDIEVVAGQAVTLSITAGAPSLK